MNITLFDLAQQLRADLSVVDPDTGEVSEAYAENRALFEQKAIACVAYAKDETAALDAAESMLKQMADKLVSRRNRLDRFKAYMQECMKATGVTEIKDDNGLFGAKLFIDRDELVEIEEWATFPPELCNQPKPPAPSKTLIKQAILEGNPIKGARIVRKDRFTLT